MKTYRLKNPATVQVAATFEGDYLVVDQTAGSELSVSVHPKADFERDYEEVLSEAAPVNHDPNAYSPQ